MARLDPERAADRRKRKSTALYWLERLLCFSLFLGALALYFSWGKQWVPDGKVYDAIAAGLLALVWVLGDRAIMYRYGRKKRMSEIIRDIKAEDAGPPDAGAGSDGRGREVTS